MPKREAISNKLRFEVFKRDSFKCQYCGKSAPEVVLNVDHLHPVSKGGGADILNLITSCFECNSGKSDRVLSDRSVVNKQKEQLDLLNERRLQLDMLIQWKEILSDKSYEINSIISFFNKVNNCNLSLTEYGERELKNLIKKYSAEKIIEAIPVLHEKYYGELSITELWNKLDRVLHFINSSENDKDKMKFFGGIKARFSSTSGYSQWNVIATNKKLRQLFEVIDGADSSLTYRQLFSILNSNYSYTQFCDDIDKLHEQILVNG